MKRSLLLLLATLPLLTGCNTIQGIGKDIQDGGVVMSHAINGNNGNPSDNR